MRITCLLLLAGLALGCSKSGSEAAGATSRITKASVEKAADGVNPPAPVAEARAKLVEILGEPTATEGEDLYWAAVSGEQCVELKLLVQKGEAKGAVSGSVSKMVPEEFDDCAAHAAK